MKLRLKVTAKGLKERTLGSLSLLLTGEFHGRFDFRKRALREIERRKARREKRI